MSDNRNITVSLRYYDYPGDFGGILEWVSSTNPKSKTYPVMVYAKLHDIVLYENLKIFEEHMESQIDDNLS